MNTEALYELYLKYPSVQTDTRKLEQGDLFFALKGPSFDGNAFASQALEMGASFAVVDDPALSGKERMIMVDDVLTALQHLARHHRGQFNIPFIAITGSNGKTTTKELVHAVLSRAFRTYTTEGNLNNHIGVPITLLKIKSDAEMAVIEMGANHLGEIASYCAIAEPTHGLITNCGKAHLEGFGGEAGVRKGKGELFDFLRENSGTAFIMKDYGYLAEMGRGISKIISYGTVDASLTGQAVAASEFLDVAFTGGISGTVHTRLVGDYNLPNVLAAAAIGNFFGVGEKDILNAIEAYEPTNSRSQLMEKGTNRIILDAYNANPSSMKAAISNFARANGNRKVLALGAMAELGDASPLEHRQVLDEISKYDWEEVLLVGDEFSKLEHPFRHFSSPAEAGSWIREHKLQNAYFLIKGSRSMKMEKILDYL